jgi:hypothetical protein
VSLFRYRVEVQYRANHVTEFALPRPLPDDEVKELAVGRWLREPCDDDYTDDLMIESVTILAKEEEEEDEPA